MHINARSGIRVSVRQYDTDDQTFSGCCFVTIDYKLLILVDRKFVIFIPLRKLVQLLRDALSGDIRQEKRNWHEAGFWLSIPLDDKDFAIAGNSVQDFSGGTPQFHHLQSFEIDFQSSSR